MAGAAIVGAAMLPAAWPAFRLHRFLGGRVQVALFAAGYVATWIGALAMLVRRRPLRAGVEYAVACTGCCAGLMLVLAIATPL